MVSKHIVSNEVMLEEVRRMIAEGHSVTIKVKGRSMLPFIVGDRDSVQLVKPGLLKERDIVMAEIQKGHYVLHRISFMAGESIVLMGDGNLRGKECCQLKDVIGKVNRIIRNGKEIDLYKKEEQIKVNIWLHLLPIRSWLLFFYRHCYLRWKDNFAQNS